MRRSPRRLAVFLGIGLLLYGMVFGLVEILGARYGQSNRFRVVQAAVTEYDFVILGASHARPLGFQGMSELLGQMTSSTVINLATPGGGVVPNRLMLSYFLEGHRAGSAVYVVDSFAFYSTEWNEDRVQDTRLWQRAPYDTALFRTLWRAASELGVDRDVAWNYLSGFSKVNDPTSWFQADPWEDDPRFGDVFQGPSYLYRQRISYLYPGEVDEVTFQRYMDLFLAMIDELRARDVGFIAIKPPLPEAFASLLPDEARFNKRLAASLEERGVPFYDFTAVNNAPDLFFDTDHLNREGVVRFFEDNLSQVLLRHHPRGL